MNALRPLFPWDSDDFVLLCLLNAVNLSGLLVKVNFGSKII